MIVFPGGGYNILAIDLEGTEVCDWLIRLASAALLSNTASAAWALPKSSAPLEDAQRAFGIDVLMPQNGTLIQSGSESWASLPGRICCCA